MDVLQVHSAVTDNDVMITDPATCPERSVSAHSKRRPGITGDNLRMSVNSQLSKPYATRMNTSAGIAENATPVRSGFNVKKKAVR